MTDLAEDVEADEPSAPLLKTSLSSSLRHASGRSGSASLLERVVAGDHDADKPARISVRVKTTADGKEYRVEARLSDTVGAFKKEICKAIGKEGMFLRLILMGKMLAPDTSKLEDFRLADDSFVHCVVSASRPRNEPAGQVRRAIAEEDIAVEEGENPADWRGFDRLRSQGISRAEVLAIRSYFSAQVIAYSSQQQQEGGTGGDLESPPAAGEGQPAINAWERQMVAEEAWMSAQSESSEFAINTGRQRRAALLPRAAVGTWSDYDETPPIGSTRDFVFGFIMGFFLRYIMLFWVFEGSVPQRQKLGILCGVLLHLTMTVFGHLMDDAASST